MLSGNLQLIAIDRAQPALRFWEAQGVRAFQSVPDGIPPNAVVVPVDENFRRQHPEFLCPWVDAPLWKLRDKDVTHEALHSAGLSNLKLPARLGKVVQRPRIGAGSRGLTITDPDTLATAYVPHTAELVVDFDSRTAVASARITHNLKHGSDTFVTVLGQSHPLHQRCTLAVWEICAVLKLRGIGNLQLLLGEDGHLHFVEVSARLSGSSWVNLLVGWNPLTGEDTRNPDLISQGIHTQGGGIVLPARTKESDGPLPSRPSDPVPACVG